MASPRSSAASRAHSGGLTRAARARLSRRGAAALEFAILLPMLTVMLLGMIDFGHLFFVVNTMTNAAREGARRGAVDPNAATVATTAQNAAMQYLTAAGLGTGCRLDCPKVTPTFAAGTVGVTIAVPGQFQNITGFTYSLPGFSSPFKSLKGLSATSQMRWELQ
ncbi:MAG: TadE/TadG family type IV pilus assembly protein [Myxococcales bacterium]